MRAGAGERIKIKTFNSVYPESNRRVESLSELDAGIPPIRENERDKDS